MYKQSCEAAPPPRFVLEVKVGLEMCYTTPVVILRPDAPAAVLVNYDEFRSMAETLHVLGSRENALRLLEAMKEMDEGRNCVTVDPREFFAK